MLTLKNMFVVVGGLQCAKPGHKPDFRKTRPDAQTGRKRGRVRGNPDIWKPYTDKVQLATSLVCLENDSTDGQGKCMTGQMTQKSKKQCC